MHEVQLPAIMMSGLTGQHWCLPVRLDFHPFFISECVILCLKVKWKAHDSRCVLVLCIYTHLSLVGYLEAGGQDERSSRNRDWSDKDHDSNSRSSQIVTITRSVCGNRAHIIGTSSADC